jgi:hypothetical protein
MMDVPATWPPGFPLALQASKDRISHRIVLVDNSSSMQHHDGKRIATVTSTHNTIPPTVSTTQTVEKCTRWDEVTAAVTALARTAAAFALPTEIRLLNTHGTMPPVVIGKSADPSGASLSQLEAVLALPPGGHTPLCQAVGAVVAQLRGMAGRLAKGGTRALLTIVTDGEASDGDVVAALRPLEQLPVRFGGCVRGPCFPPSLFSSSCGAHRSPSRCGCAPTRPPCSRTGKACAPR